METLMKLVILFLLISSSVATFNAVKFVRTFIDTVDSNITQVRTREERNRRWKEFPVLDFIGLVEQHEGYKAEEYDVKTSDGYILKLHRISASPFSPKKPGKPVVYIGHGLFVSSDFYVLLGTEQALAYQLADAGYDVWIGNHRGNTYSKRHINRSPVSSNYDFWKFSMDDYGLIDLPTLIDKALEVTNQAKLTYIGYSMGTTVSYMLLAEKPEYNEKMNLVVSLAPEAIFTPPHSPLLNNLVTIMPLVRSVIKSSRIYQIIPRSKFVQIFGKNICVTETGQKLCRNLLENVVHTDQINLAALPQMFANLPSGTSFNVIDHYYQLITTGKFAKYNFGAYRNRNNYNSPKLQEYDLTKISSPQAIFFSPSDSFATVRDTIKLKNKLQNVVAFEQVPDKYNHLDFGWNLDARKDIYNRVLELIAQNA